MKIQDNSAAFEENLKVKVRRFLEQAAIIVNRKARELCARRSGELVRSISYIIEENRALIGSNLPQAPIMELGSKPHTILPNVKAALFWPGLDHPVKRVKHPGTRPIPFLRPALEASKKDIEELAKSEGII